MIKNTKHTLTKIETLYKEAGFQVRYGKGNFHAGHCILDSKKQIVVNKLFTLDARISCLMDILPSLKVNPDLLSNTSLDLFKKIIQSKKTKAKAKA